MALPTIPPLLVPAMPGPPTSGARTVRWAVLLGLSALLHWLALTHLDEQRGRPVAGHAPAHIPTEVRLIPSKPAKPLPPAQPRPRRAPPLARPQPVASSETVIAKTSAAEANLPLVTENANDASAPDFMLASAAPEGLEDASLQEAAQENVPRYRAEPLPSATLKYKVEALRQGNMVYGSGKIHWHTDGLNYAIRGEAGILFFSLLDFESQGIIDEHGVSPLLYTQKRFRRSATNTHFHRERNLISFSASTQSYPRHGGEQDRASMIWQLAAIGRADPTQFSPGEDFSLPVAGVRDMQNWEIKVLTQEEVETGAGTLMAWRIARTPPPGSYDQKLEIWLSPDLGWYPVKLRHTDYNGEYLDMILSELAAPAAD